MDLIIIILSIALLGCLVWAITTYIPMAPVFKTIIYILAAVALILFLIRQFSGQVPNVLH